MHPAPTTLRLGISNGLAKPVNAPEQRLDQRQVKRSRGRPPTSDEATRRLQIIEAARQAFAELGYAGTTTDIVATRCQISKQTLYRLFPSKQELFVAATNISEQRLLALPRPIDEQAPIEETIARIFRIDRDDDDQAILVRTIVRDSSVIPELADALGTSEVLRSRQDLAEWLSAQVAKGLLRLDDPLSGARLLMDMIFGGMNPPDGWSSPEQEREHLRLCIMVFLRGTAP
ncbi:MAG: TetR/AcrR family transcriptional regulator [Rhizobium sp.]|jgi:AcrR family transcriptional regulator|uniref:TetR/AcrR family transcriptional regulator n=1 Tax=Rhizobium sp. TaxID=391 RepID=UPI0009DE6BE6